MILMKRCLIDLDIYYFIAAPTLVYEENFPRTSGIRWKFLGKLVLEFVWNFFFINNWLDICLLYYAFHY